MEVLNTARNKGYGENHRVDINKKNREKTAKKNGENEDEKWISLSLHENCIQSVKRSLKNTNTKSLLPQRIN
jgi:hypothetical protein